MRKKFKETYEMLKIYNQEHLLAFFNELDINKQKHLLNQIDRIDFSKILKLYDNSMINRDVLFENISPLKYYEKKDFSNSQLSTITQIGEDIIKSSQFAVVTMAGGQGTRLGYRGPKGTYEIDFDTYKKSLFEIMCDKLKMINMKYNVEIPWYIMTSEDNNEETKMFFLTHDFFGYPKSKIVFFKQNKLPLIDTNKKIMLKDLHTIYEASNGNGNVFESLKNNNILKQMKDNNIKWVSFSGIDNILLKPVDPFFLGITIYNNLSVASKTIFKDDPTSKIAVFCKEYEKPTILNYSDITPEISEMKDENNRYLYRDINILSHLMSLDSVIKVSDLNLPYHRARKKNAFINDEGMKQIPEIANSFKFELFIFDAFLHFDDMLLYRVKENEEFAPIKDFSSIYNPDSAKEKFLAYNNKSIINSN